MEHEATGKRLEQIPQSAECVVYGESTGFKDHHEV